jgi:hypothetical protein
LSAIKVELASYSPTLVLVPIVQKTDVQTPVKPQIEIQEETKKDINDSIYLNPNDREDISHDVEPTHPAAVYKEMHDRKLSLSVSAFFIYRVNNCGYSNNSRNR